MACGYDKTQFTFCITHVLHAYLQTHYNSINVSFTLCVCRLKRLSKPPLHFSVSKPLEPFSPQMCTLYLGFSFLNGVLTLHLLQMNVLLLFKFNTGALGQLRRYLVFQGTLRGSTRSTGPDDPDHQTARAPVRHFGRG